MRRRYLAVIPFFILLVLLPLLPYPPTRETGNTPHTLGAPIGPSSNNSYPIPRTILIESDPTTLVDEFSYLAAIPLGVYTTSGGIQYRSPVVFIEDKPTVDYFLDDWGAYLRGYSNTTQVIGVGEFNSSIRNNIQSHLHQKISPVLPMTDIFSTAAALAQYDWINATTVYLAPINSTNPVSQVSSGAFSASFSGVSTTSQSFSGSVSNGMWSNHSLMISATQGFVTGNLSWAFSSNRYLTHLITSSSGVHTDYSTPLYSYWQNQYSLPVLSEFVSGETGTWNVGVYGENPIGNLAYDFSFTKYPSKTEIITVPDNAQFLNVSISWSNLFHEINLYAISPSGYVADLSTVDNAEQSIVGEEISVNHPEAGDWKLVMVWMNPSTSTDVTGTYDIVTTTPALEESLLAASNGAILASSFNAPLLYLSPNAIPTATTDALSQLNTSQIVVVDPAGVLSQSVYTSLQGGFNVTYLANVTSLIEFWNLYTNITSLVIANADDPLRSFILGGSLAGAIKSAPVLVPNSTVYTAIQGAWSAYSNPLPTEPRSLEGISGELNLDDRLPNRYTMQQVGDLVRDWITDSGINSSILETL
ncbi:MAG: hypothetical protein ACXACA_06180, partial [Candidatus Ranarchaeia archaeon]